jgi:hypothetical protein
MVEHREQSCRSLCPEQADDPGTQNQPGIRVLHHRQDRNTGWPPLVHRNMIVWIPLLVVLRFLRRVLTFQSFRRLGTFPASVKLVFILFTAFVTFPHADFRLSSHVRRRDPEIPSMQMNRLEW